MKQRIAPGLLSITFLIAMGSANCFAQFTEHVGDYGFELAQKKSMSASEAAKKAQSEYGGKVLSVEEKTTDSGVVYYVKLLLDNGRVKTVTIRG